MTKAQEARNWLDLIKMNVERISELTKDYPAYIYYSNRYYVITCLHALRELHESLVQELQGYGEDVSGDNLIIL